MAGFREFVTGEVLTAANVDDFLMKQTVQKYADAAARDAALGTAVGGGNALREGMVAYLDSTDEVIKYDGTAWTTIGNAGIGSNVVQTVKTNAFSTTSTSFVDITGYDVSITPTSASSKVLVVALISFSQGDGGAPTALPRFRLRRDSTDILLSTAGSSRNDTVSSPIMAADGDVRNATVVFLDSPETTSATVYRLQMAVVQFTGYVNRRGDTGNNDGQVSTITAIEVAA